MKIVYSKNIFLYLFVLVLITNGTAQNMLVDDFSDGNAINAFGETWVYYDDNDDVSPNGRSESDPGSVSSIINVPFIERPRHSYGDKSDTWMVRDYTITLDTIKTNAFATIPFTFGEKWNAARCKSDEKCAWPYVGISTLLAPEGSYFDVTGATGVTFKIRSRDNACKVSFRVQTFDILMDSSFAFYHDTFTTSTDWQTITIPFTNLNQPGWVATNQQRAFNKKQATHLSWEMHQEQNPSITADTIDIDSLCITNCTYSPIPPLLIDDFEKGYMHTNLGSFWYFINDSAKGGASVINNAEQSTSFKGGYGPGRGSSYAAILDFTMSNNYPYPYVGMGFYLDPNGNPVDLTDAYSLQFDIKASREMLVRAEVAQSTIAIDDGDFYHKDCEVDTSWSTVIINIATGKGNLAQDPNWGADKAFDVKKIKMINWLYTAEENGGDLSPATLSVDNIKILGNPAGLPPPFSPAFLPYWGGIDVPIDPVFTWTRIPDADSYTVQISKSTLFDSLVVNDSGLTDTTYHLPNLDYGTTYYRRVNALKGSVSGRWSCMSGFTTIFDTPSAPLLSLPVNNATGVPLAVTLTWEKTSGAKTYRLQIAPDSLFSSLVVNDTGTTDTASIHTLLNATTYYWKVCAHNTRGTSNWSAVHSFTTIEPKPGAPKLCAPTADAADVPISTTLVWNKVAYAATYTIQLSTGSNFSSFTIDTTGISDTVFTIPGLINSTEYFWRVCAVNPAGTGLWSTIRVFTTMVASPDQPRLFFPTNDAIHCAITLPLQWHPVIGAFSYNVTIATDSEFTHTIIDSTAVSDTNMHLSNLNNNTTYYWRVSANNKGGTGIFSVIRHFTTIVPLPEKVSLLAITDTIAANDVDLFWNGSSPNVIQYIIKIATDSSMANAVIDTISDTTYKATIHSGTTVYWWQVCAENAAGVGEYSEKGVFVVTLPLSVIVPKAFTVVSFKNSNSLNRIRYALPVKCDVTLLLYNIQGSIVRRIRHQKQNPGVYTEHLNALSSGAYYLSFSAGTFRYADTFIYTR